MLAHVHNIVTLVRACLHGGKGTQVGEITCGGSPHLSCKHDWIKMRDYMDRRVTPLSGLFHLPGVPYLHVNRPLVCVAGGIIHATCGECEGDTFFFSRLSRQNLHSRKNNRLFSLFVCFPISGNIMVPQRTFSFKCRLMLVNPRAYVCIITEILFTEIFLFSFLFFKFVCLFPRLYAGGSYREIVNWDWMNKIEVEVEVEVEFLG